MILARWHGGHNYVESDEIEQFPSEAAAREALRSRLENGGWQPQQFHLVGQEPISTLTPCVDLTSRLDLVMTDGDMYARLEFGPRGGIRKVSA